MPDPTSSSGRRFTDEARKAALSAKAAKRDAPDTFGQPELFIVKADGQAFTWELRRFGGISLQRGAEAFASAAMARAGGELALAILCASPDLPTFAREPEGRRLRHPGTEVHPLRDVIEM